MFWCTHCTSTGTLDSESALANSLERLDLYSCYAIVFQKTHQGKAPSGALDRIQNRLAREMTRARLKAILLLVLFFQGYSQVLRSNTAISRDSIEKDAGPAPGSIFEAIDFISSLGGGFIFRNRLRAMCKLRTWLMVNKILFLRPFMLIIVLFQSQPKRSRLLADLNIVINEIDPSALKDAR